MTATSCLLQVRKWSFFVTAATGQKAGLSIGAIWCLALAAPLCCPQPSQRRATGWRGQCLVWSSGAPVGWRRQRPGPAAGRVSIVPAARPGPVSSMNRTKQWLSSLTALFIVKPAGGALWFSLDAHCLLITGSSATGRMAWFSPAAVDEAITGQSLCVLLASLHRDRLPYPGCSGGKSERSDWATSGRTTDYTSTAVLGTWCCRVVRSRMASSLNQLLPPHCLGAARR